MAIQYSEGAIKVDADDPQFTHRGRTIAVKVRYIIWPVVLGVLKQPDGSWEAEVDLTGDLFASDPPGGGDAVEYALQAHGGSVGFILDIIRPRLQAWLDQVWPPITGDEEPTPAGKALEELASAIRGLKFVVQSNGTVIVAL